MRPIALQISAFGPYLARQDIDFEQLGQHGLFLIHGRTGSGKSSVLDALCFALFGKSTGEERKGEDFVTTLDRGAETRVQLDFEHLGRKYRVTRSPTQPVAKKRGDGFTTRQTEASLVDLGADEVLASRAGDVTAAIEEMLRCDVGQFRQTVVLPQGDFRRVVTEHKARRDILASIFRTERFAALADRLADTAKTLTRAGQDLQEQRTQLLADHGAENVADLTESVREAAGAAEAALAAKRQAAAAKDAAIAAEAAGKALLHDFAVLHDERLLAERLAALEDDVEAKRQVAARAEKAARLVGQRDELAARRDEHSELGAQLAAAREELSATAKALEERRAEQAELEPLRPRLEAVASEFHRLTALKPKVDGLAEKLKRRSELTEERSRLEAANAAAETAISDLTKRITVSQEAVAGLASLLAGEVEANELLARARADIDLKSHVALALEKVAFLDAELEAHSGRSDPVAMLSEAVRANAPGLLATELEEGQPCTVCGSVHHPSPTVHGDVESLRLAFEEFGQAAGEHAGLRERKRAYEADITARLAERGWQGGAPPSSQLTAALEAAEARLAELADAKAKHAGLTQELQGLENELQEQSRAVTDLRARVGGVEGDIKGITGEVKGALEGLDPDHHDPAAFNAALEAARAESESLRLRLDEASSRVAAAENATVLATSAVNGAESRLASAGEKLEGLETKFSAKLAKAGFTAESDFDDAALSEDELAELQLELREHDEAVKVNAATIARLAGKLKDEQRPDEEALEAEVQSAREVEAAAETALATANGALDRAGKALERFETLVRKDAEVAERRRAAQKLSDLANGGLKGRAKVNFETFVLRSIFAKVLDEGNRHLKHMTGGRYALLLVGDPSGRDTGLELNVSDNASGGEVRPVHTLSGGEGFLASLALALGLSEISQRESGGVELGALFIDEGFGSLDSQALDQVIDILRGLEHGHRMVGIISHVEDLKRRVPVQLLVLEDRVGSRVEMRLNA